MKLTPWKPKNKFTNIDDLFGLDHPFFGLTLFPEMRQLSEETRGWTPAIDVTEEKDHFMIKADLPGITKDDIELSAEGTVLTIKGERKYE
ncbi:MAG: Hsp20/alpha crystallin family protein, partial [Candidatus Omnitrophica bacterium]|nr:Hsp20/alpha crystallin family protein [Candidatus Omnitrophota bacterium]